MLIYLRHGDDRGDDVYRHDRHLNDRGIRTARKKAKKLIKEYGHPDAVYVSPYRRTLETLHALSSRFERPVSVRLDPRIAQYLGRKRDPQISPETAAQVAIVENQEAFDRRIAEHVAEVRSLSVAAVWCVSHQVVIEAIGRYFDMDVTRDLDFLDHVIVLS